MNKIFREFKGTVTSVGMNKTITVQVDSMKMNQKYQKKYRVSKKYHVHDETGTTKLGDAVRFIECRPISKTKRWTLIATNQENKKTKKQ